MHYIVAVRLTSGGTKTEHISQVIWVNASSYASGMSPTASMMDFVEKNPGTVRVTDGNTTATVEVVNRSPKYLRSERDNSKTDNLLSITRF